MRPRDSIDTIEVLLRRQGGFVGGEMSFFLENEGGRVLKGGDVLLGDLGKYENGKFVFENGGNLVMDFIFSMKIQELGPNRFLYQPEMISGLRGGTRCEELSNILDERFNLGCVNCNFYIAVVNSNNLCVFGNLFDYGVRGEGSVVFVGFIRRI